MELIIRERNQIDDIEFNYSELKSELADKLIKYKGIVYDDSAIALAKKERAALNNLKKSINDRKVEIKKECLKPYDDFETKVKELLNMIDKPTLEIDTQIKNYEERAKLKKKEDIEKLVVEVIAEQELNNKYASQLIIIDKYCNLTAKEKDIKDDLISRAITLKVEQDREAELIEIIKDTIESENLKINTKLTFTDFQRYVDRGISTKEILQEVKARAANIYRAENPLKVEPIIEPVKEPIVETKAEPIFEPIEKEIIEPKYYANYKITGELRQLRGVSDYLKANNITYEVGEQGKI